MTETTEPKTLTITMTNTAPVRIRDEDWPVIAYGRYGRHDNEYKFQANRTWEAEIYVRKNADGRMIVSGMYDYDTVIQSELGFATHAGIVLDAEADPVAAIRQVGATLSGATDEAGHEFGSHISEAVRNCIADLPAQEL